MLKRAGKGTDFDIYSTLDDALAGTNKWASYGFGGTDVGFPGTSGPSAASSDQYSSIAVSECSSSSTQTGKQSNFYIYEAELTKPFLQVLHAVYILSMYIFLYILYTYFQEYVYTIYCNPLRAFPPQSWKPRPCKSRVSAHI